MVHGFFLREAADRAVILQRIEAAVAIAAACLDFIAQGGTVLRDCHPGLVFRLKVILAGVRDCGPLLPGPSGRRVTRPLGRQRMTRRIISPYRIKRYSFAKRSISGTAVSRTAARSGPQSDCKPPNSRKMM